MKYKTEDITRKSLKSIKLHRYKYHYLLNRNVTHDSYVSTSNLLRKCKEAIDDENDLIRNDIELNKKTLFVSLPYPVTKAVKAKSVIDPCEELLKHKSKYEKKIRWCAQEYKKNKSKLSLDEDLEGVNQMRIPRYLLDLTFKQMHDPDPHFEGDYNWYYTGNSLDVTDIDNQKFIVRPINQHMLCFTNWHKNKNYTFDVQTQPIYSISCFNIDNANCISVRCKNSVNLLSYMISDEDKIMSSLLWQYDSKEVPIIDAKINKYKLSSVGILNVNRDLSVYNMIKSKETLYSINPVDGFLEDKLMQFEFLSKKHVILIDRNAMYSLDIRSKDILGKKLLNDYFVCNNLCGLTPSKKNENYIYIISTHDILKVDLRLQSVVKRWPHLLKHSPNLIYSFPQEGDEVIIFASQNSNGKAFLIDSDKENNICKHIPSNMSTLKYSNLKKIIVREDISKRLNCSNIGIGSILDNNECKMLFANSLGDTFASTLSCYDQDMTKPVEMLQEWIAEIPMKEKELVVTAFREMSHAKHCLDLAVDNRALEKFTNENFKLQDLFDKNNMDNFEMGAIWDEDEDDDEDVLNKSMTADNKVSQWLNSNWS